MADKLAQCRLVREQAKRAFKVSNTTSCKRGVKSKTEILRRNQCAAAAARYARDEYTKALESAVNSSECEREVYALKAVASRARRDALAAEVLRLKDELGIPDDNSDNDMYDTKQFIKSVGVEMNVFTESLLRWPTCAAL